jgi:hypothetical protein
VAAGALALAAAGLASAQTVAYAARERLADVDRPDSACAVAVWTEEVPNQSPRRWVYTAGFGTEHDGSGNPHTRWVVYKYDADAVSRQDPPWEGPPDPTAVAYFPPRTQAYPPAGQHAATAMAVDGDGSVYVAGYTTLARDTATNGADTNYVVVKYDKDLNVVWSGASWGGVTGAVGYDGASHGNDAATAIAVHPRLEADGVFVTGYSHGGSENGDDLVTLRLDAATGAFAVWPAAYGEGLGIRRWHEGYGHDRPAGPRAPSGVRAKKGFPMRTTLPVLAAPVVLAAAAAAQQCFPEWSAVGPSAYGDTAALETVQSYVVTDPRRAAYLAVSKGPWIKP